MPDKYDIIVRDLASVRARGGVFGIFGEESHGYLLNSPQSVKEIAAFEAEHRVCLPANYRQFLIRVGNGGAGPYYGLFKLGVMDDGFDCGPWTDFVGDLSSPFPHQDAWNDLTGKPDDQMPMGSDEYDAAIEAFDQRYFDRCQISGAIPICHIGCALRQLLIITGPEAGHIWSDDRADYKGLSPLKGSCGVRTTFHRWYREWLDEVLAKMQIGEKRN